MVRAKQLITIAMVVSCGALHADPSKKLISTGWDSPTPAQFKQYLSQFEKWPFDGTTIQTTRTNSAGKVVDAKNAFSHEHWAAVDFDSAIAELRAAKPRICTDNFLMLNANPGDVDWFDDAGWREIVQHWRYIARAAKRGGLKGILFDSEPYTPPYQQFHYASQKGAAKHTFAQYCAKARERGREVMRAVAAEYPDITLFSYRLLCDLIPLFDSPGDDAELLEGNPYGLLPAFFNGWLDVAPAGTRFVDGNENAYTYNSPAMFDRAYTQLHTGALRFIDTANRSRFRAQYQVGHGIYLDAHANPPTSPWYIDPLGGSRASRLEANVLSALRAADHYIWIYGETGNWWPNGNPAYPMWPQKLQDADGALARAKNPVDAARKLVHACKPEANILRNGGFTQATVQGAVDSWWFWQDEKSHGVASHDKALGAARLSGMANGCYGQSIRVTAGDRYVVGVRIKRQGSGGAGVLVGWKNAAGAWTVPGDNVRLLPVAQRSSDGWRECCGVVTVPANVSELEFMLFVEGQMTPADAVWFDDAILAPLGG